MSFDVWASPSLRSFLQKREKTTCSRSKMHKIHGLFVLAKKHLKNNYDDLFFMDGVLRALAELRWAMTGHKVDRLRFLQADEPSFAGVRFLYISLKLQRSCKDASVEGI